MSEVNGLSTIIKNLTKASLVIQESTTEEIELLANQIKNGSIERAPLKTGDLVDSHKVVIKQDGFYVTVGPVYGNDGQDYTVRMHEEDYNLGPKSEAKNFGEPHRGIGVGKKFLTRSYEHFYRGALTQMKIRVSEKLNGAIK